MKNKVLIIAACFLSSTSYAEQDLQEGKHLFESRCSGCHAIDKKVVGPSLRGVSERREQKWIVDFVRSSQEMVAKSDPVAVKLFNEFNGIIMPDHTDLSEVQVNNIVAFIEQEKASPVESSQANNLKVVAPYKGKKSIVDKIVYLNFEGKHTPMRKDDTLGWAILLLSVGCLIVLLCVVVHANELRYKLVRKKQSERT